MKLIYCAIPSRISKKSAQIMDYVESKNNAAFNPFSAFPLDRFEFGKIGRKTTIDYCKRVIEICDELWIFGLSEGTIEEMDHAIKTGKTVNVIKEFDDDWECEKSKFKDKLGLLSTMIKF